MRNVMVVLVVAGLVLTLGILLAGVLAMARGGEFNRKYGNRLMRARLISQFGVVILLFLLFMLAGE